MIPAGFEYCPLHVAAPDLLKACQEVTADYNQETCCRCDGTGIEPNTKSDACYSCGGYGWNPTGDIHDAILIAKDAIAKARRDTDEARV